MEFNLNKKVNINISNLGAFTKTYNTIIVKPNDNVLTQEMLSEPNTKYIIIYNFDLNGEVITLPENCILEINGGDIYNGTLIGNYTRVINTNEVDILKNNIILAGTWETRTSPNLIYLPENLLNYLNIGTKWFVKLGQDGIAYLFLVYNNKYYNFASREEGKGLVLRNTLIVEETDNYNIYNLPEEARETSLSYTNDNGFITITLPDNFIIRSTDVNNTEIYRYTDSLLIYSQIPTLTLEMFTVPGGKYIIRYDYTLNGETIELPEGSYLVFDGGNIKDGTIICNNTKIINPYKIEIEASLSGNLHYTDFFHEIMTELEFEVLQDKREDTLYFIIEE